MRDGSPRRGAFRSKSGGPMHIGGLVEELARRVERTTALDRLGAVWSQVVGPEIGGQTAVSAFRRGVLEVEVESAALLSELSTFYREVLLGALQTAVRELPGRRSAADVQELRFRLGGLRGPKPDEKMDRTR